jgi:hypothetical protein
VRGRGRAGIVIVLVMYVDTRARCGQRAICHRKEMPPYSIDWHRASPLSY